MRQICDILPKLIAIERKLSELLVLIGQLLVVRFELLYFVLSKRDHVNVSGQATFQIVLSLPIAIIHQACQALHHTQSMVVPAQRQSQLLRLSVVVEQLLVLVTKVINHVLVLQRALSEHLEPFGRLHCARQELPPRALLQQVLLVRVKELPAGKGMAQVRLPMLLPIRQEVQPMTHYFPHLHETPPPVEHFRLEVVVRAVPVPEASDAPGEKLVAFLCGAMGDVIDLEAGEALVCHQFAQIVHLELLFEDLLGDRSNLIHVDHGLGVEGLFLPFIEIVSHLHRYEMSKHDLLLFLNDFIPMDLPA